MYQVEVIKPNILQAIYYEFKPERWAWLDLIAWCEGTDKKIEEKGNIGYSLYSLKNYRTKERIEDTETGYDITFGFKEVADLSKHPKIHVPFGKTTSTAFGRYQIMDFTDTWIKKYLYDNKLTQFPSYQPQYQDQMCLLLIDAKRKSLQFVDQGLAGFEQALNKLSYEWASLPPGRYGQGFHPLSVCQNIFVQALSKWKAINF